MGNDNSLSTTLNLDEAKSEKILKQQMANLQKKLQNMLRIGLNITVDKNALEQQVRKMNSSFDKIYHEQLVTVKLDMKKKNVQSDIEQFMNSNSKMSDDLKAKFIVLKKEIDKVDDTNSLITLKNQLSDLKNETLITGQAGKSFGDIFKNAMSKLYNLRIKEKIISQVKDSIEELRGIDTILTDIGKTSNYTKNQLKQLGDSSFETASTYGKKASDYLSKVQKMANSGYTGNQGKDLAEQSLLAQTAGNMSAETADNYILALNAAYKFNGEAKKLNEVLDGRTNIATHNNISLNNMAEAMSTIGTAASGYRVSVEELSAMIGTIGSVTHNTGSEIGNSVNSILSNLQNTDSSEIVKTLDAVHVSMTEIVNGSEQLRDPISILRDLSDAYNQLGETDSLKGEILANIGGNDQANELSALLENMNTFNQMLTDYAGGSGSAMEAAMSTADSWEGSLNRLSNTWTDTVGNFVNSDAIISGINALNSLLEMINKLTDALGPINSLALAGGLFAGIKNVGRVKMFTLIKYADSNKFSYQR